MSFSSSTSSPSFFSASDSICFCHICAKRLQKEKVSVSVSVQVLRGYGRKGEGAAPVLLEQLLVRALLDDLALGHDDDEVVLDDGAQPARAQNESQ